MLSFSRYLPIKYTPFWQALHVMYAAYLQKKKKYVIN